MDNNQEKHIGKKIIYTLVIVMSSLILLWSAISIIGIWIVQHPLTDTSLNILNIVQDSNSTVRKGISRVDDKLAILQAGTTEITEITEQLSKDVTDKGLVMLLLPEEKEQQLSNNAEEIRDTFDSVREPITKGLDLYRSVNKLPFINLPTLSDDQMGQIESTTSQIQDTAASLRSSIIDFRSGAAGRVDNVSTAANNLSDLILEGRNAIDALDTKLVALELLTNRLQRILPCLLLTIAVLLTIILAFVIYTQIEVIRLFVFRWRQLSQPMEISEADLQVEPA